MVRTTFGDMVLDNHISDGLGAESNMHAESAIGFSTRSILRTHPTAFQQGCIFDTQPLEKMAQRQLEDLISQRFTESIGLRDQNDCRTAKVVLQNHDVCPLGFPHVFLTTVRLPAALLTGPCLYLASCRSHCSSTRVVADYMSLPRENAARKRFKSALDFSRFQHTQGCSL
jgi:hypothetical protein